MITRSRSLVSEVLQTPKSSVLEPVCRRRPSVTTTTLSTSLSWTRSNESHIHERKCPCNNFIKRHFNQYFVNNISRCLSHYHTHHHHHHHHYWWWWSTPLNSRAFGAQLLCPQCKILATPPVTPSRGHPNEILFFCGRIYEEQWTKDQL